MGRGMDAIVMRLGTRVAGGVGGGLFVEGCVEIAACRFCGLTHEMPAVGPGMVAKCARCGSAIEKRTPGSLHVTAALSLAALILYVPANVFPIMVVDMYGVETENTVWSGVRELWMGKDYPIAIIVFLASIAIPLLKLLGLFFVVIATWLGSRRGLVFRTWVYRVIATIGRWSMLDIFVLAVLVSAVKLEQLATITAGKGMLAFAGVVVLTLLASESFDPELIWRTTDEARRGESSARVDTERAPRGTEVAQRVEPPMDAGGR